ncbi:MAG: type II toxin-antitoxin system VapC family toxin [Chloroflexi bacterium]|nr:type II toxin-antitoxin system VapC family toxin [Chloroflexota bacterium]
MTKKNERWHTEKDEIYQAGLNSTCKGTTGFFCPHLNHVEIVIIDPDLFIQTIAFYQSRSDKAWGLTDCASFVIMQQHSLHEALTADKHFQQAGFLRLLHLPFSRFDYPA